ncbi:unnamed protein product, partial [Mesorhabditis belari]
KRSSLFFEEEYVKKWDLRKPIKYTFHESLEEWDKNDVRMGIAEITRNVECLKFEFLDSAPSGPHLHFMKIENSNFCGLSYTGRLDTGNPIYLSFTCGNPRGIAIHEIMHALGVAHQHLRTDRDDWIEIDWTNINPQHYDMFAVSNARMFTTYGIPYDYKSIMHYNAYTAAVDTRKPTMKPRQSATQNIRFLGQRDQMSTRDIELLKKMYCKLESCWDTNVFCDTKQVPPWGYAEAIGLIGAFLSKDYEKNPSRNVLQDVKNYANSLNRAKGLSEEDQKKVMENLLGIGEMKMDNLSSKLTDDLKTKIGEAGKSYRESLAKHMLILEKEQELPESVKTWMNEMIIKPLKETQQLFEAYLSNQQSTQNSQKFEQKINEEKVKNLGTKFSSLMKEGIKKLQAEVLQEKRNNYRHFDALTDLMQRAQVVYNMIELMRNSIIFSGDGGKVNELIKQQNANRNATEVERSNWKVSASENEFNYNAVNLTDDGFKEKEALKTIYQKFANNNWKDGSPINYYFLLSYDEKPMTKSSKNYTHIVEINNKTVVLHMRSQLMEMDPKSAPYLWFNWYPKMARTLEFEILDELNRIDPTNQTMEELQKVVHDRAIKKCLNCQTILTSIDGPSDSYSDGKEPSPAGRLIRIFSKISVFIGF